MDERAFPVQTNRRGRRPKPGGRQKTRNGSTLGALRRLFQLHRPPKPKYTSLHSTPLSDLTVKPIPLGSASRSTALSRRANCANDVTVPDADRAGLHKPLRLASRSGATVMAVRIARHAGLLIPNVLESRKYEMSLLRVRPGSRG